MSSLAPTRMFSRNCPNRCGFRIVYAEGDDNYNAAEKAHLWECKRCRCHELQLDCTYAESLMYTKALRTMEDFGASMSAEFEAKMAEDKARADKLSEGHRRQFYDHYHHVLFQIKQLCDLRFKTELNPKYNIFAGCIDRIVCEPVSPRYSSASEEEDDVEMMA